MLPHDPASYDDLLARFRWAIPPHFNIGVACSDAIAARNPDAPAIIDATDEEVQTLGFGALADQSTRLASSLSQIGLARGDRIAVMIPQSAQAVMAHLAIYKLGAIAVPLATQFGPRAIAHRLDVSGARAMIGSEEALERARGHIDRGGRQIATIAANGRRGADRDLVALIARGEPDFIAASTTPDDPSMMLFTSGTTGQPKGALHGHRVLLGHLPGIEMAQNLSLDDGAVMWTPSDWAWAGGLLNALLPALCSGVPVVAARGPKFDAAWAVSVMERAGVTNAFMPATALRMMQGADVAAARQRLKLRAIGTAGEALGAQTLAAAQRTFGVPVNEFYGQTECNAVLANCATLGIGRPGAMGKPVAGHQVSILRADGTPADTDEPGEVAIADDSPVMFLGYWNDDAATTERFAGRWLMTGDRARRDSDGYVHFIGRADDLITSAGYRIGPAEIEDCLMAHDDVALAAVIGEPDPLRTEIVSAFVQLRPGLEEDAARTRSIIDFVRTRLSAHQYPRRITFVDEIPLTESGKVIRRHFRKPEG